MQVLETLNKHQLLENIKKCNFVQQTLVYLGYVNYGGELKIDPTKIKAMMEWSIHTNYFEVNIFIEITQFLRKSIASFSTVAALVHAITSGKSI